MLPSILQYFNILSSIKSVKNSLRITSEIIMVSIYLKGHVATSFIVVLKLLRVLGFSYDKWLILMLLFVILFPSRILLIVVVNQFFSLVLFLLEILQFFIFLNVLLFFNFPFWLDLIMFCKVFHLKLHPIYLIVKFF